MAAYKSAELGRTVDFPPPGLDRFVPAVARGAWQPNGREKERSATDGRSQNR
jgi:hypothetical protein